MLWLTKRVVIKKSAITLRNLSLEVAVKLFVIALVVVNLFFSSSAVATDCLYDPDLQTLVPKGGTGVAFQKNTLLTEPLAGAITGTYIPPYGVLDRMCGYDRYYDQATLKQAAYLLGYKHFNWLQVVIRNPPGLTFKTASGDPLPNAPFVDPLPGGFDYLWADDLLYYWDESEKPWYSLLPYSPENQLSYNTRDSFPSALVFWDQPVRVAYPPGDFSRFATHLVGVKSDINWSLLATQFWSSDYTYSHGGGVLRGTPEDYPEATGGVFDLQDVSINNLPDSYKRFLVSLGADNISVDSPVPEPSALSLLLVGWLSLMVSLRRRPACV